MSSTSSDDDAAHLTLVKDWLESDSEDGKDTAFNQFDKSHFEGDRGHLRLQL